MAAKQPDRRVKRTRQLLADALISLVVEQGYDEVTVQQILDRAGVGRSTFYSHFRDKEELFRSSLENLRVGLTRQWNASLAAESKPLGELAFALPFFRHVDGARHLHRAFSRGDSALIMDQQLRRMFADMIRIDIAPWFNSQTSDDSFEAAVQFVVGAMTSMITWWMEHKTRLSAEELNSAFLQLALSGLKSLSRQS